MGRSTDEIAICKRIAALTTATRRKRVDGAFAIHAPDMDGSGRALADLTPDGERA